MNFFRLTEVLRFLKNTSSLGSFWSAIIGEPRNTKTMVREMQNYGVEKEAIHSLKDLI
jgi:hypothetical protein